MGAGLFKFVYFFLSDSELHVFKSRNLAFILQVHLGDSRRSDNDNIHSFWDIYSRVIADNYLFDNIRNYVIVDNNLNDNYLNRTIGDLNRCYKYNQTHNPNDHINIQTHATALVQGQYIDPFHNVY